mmetsp:Transcript_2513/g.2911  ORF Transcript_2513/g.2911 Transcript_2513/m.2911 type:complete len:311 (-) Transcript_2513:1883-2815(-)
MKDDVFQVFLAGVLGAVRVQKTLLYIVTSRVTAVRTIQCFTLNGVIFLGSIAVFDFLLKPGIFLIGKWMRIIHSEGFRRFDYRQDDYVNSDSELLNDYFKSVEGGIDHLTSLIFTFAWLVPMYALSFILNTVWYRDIAEQVFRQEKGRLRGNESIAAILRDEIYRLLLMAWSSILSFLLSIVPYFGTFSCLFYTSWIYAFYCYDYKWTMQGWSFEKRLGFFQDHWVYMLGFGMPCSVVTIWFPQFVGYGLYAMIFPVCMILAIISTPVRHKSLYVPESIRMFYPCEIINLYILRRIAPRQGENVEPNTNS